jgi:hypothetical protein
MKQRPDLEKKINDVLDSLDGIQPAEPRPYFYTRVLARLKRDEATGWSVVGSFLGKPAIAIAGLFLILVMNIFIVTRQDSNQERTMPAAIMSGLGSELGTTDNEYIIASSSSFDYENIDQQ